MVDRTPTMNKCQHTQNPLAARHANAAWRLSLRKTGRLRKRVETAKCCVSEIAGVAESDIRDTRSPASSAAKSSKQTDCGRSIAQKNVVTWQTENAAWWLAALAKSILSMWLVRLRLAGIALGHVSLVFTKELFASATDAECDLRQQTTRASGRAGVSFARETATWMHGGERTGRRKNQARTTKGVHPVELWQHRFAKDASTSE